MAKPDVFSALADPVRRGLLARLAVRPERVVDLASDHDISRPAISRHLKVLGDAGLVRANDRGRERHYEIDRAPLDEVDRFLDLLAVRRPPVAVEHLAALTTEVYRSRRDATTTIDERPSTQEQSA